MRLKQILNNLHRDIAIPNIMMDAKTLYPDGHHPVRLGFSPDALYRVSPLPREGNPVRYFYIDFGLSLRFPAGTVPSAIGIIGRDREIPELSDSVPYDPFKVDVFALGNLYAKEFEQVQSFLDFTQLPADVFGRNSRVRSSSFH